MSLNDYFLKHIMGPLGIKNVNMFPTPDMKKNLAYMHNRSPEGKLRLTEEGHTLNRPLIVTSEEDIKATFNQGGAGCFANPAEYCREVPHLATQGSLGVPH